MIIHIDMDAFYASVEALDHPELAEKCIVVGGLSGRGVVSAANYAARAYGVHSAMPIFEARRKCPQAVFIAPRMKRYQQVSRRIMALIASFSPMFQPVSIDEAFLDISGCERLHGDAYTVAMRIKARIRRQTGLSCSVGVAPLRFLAKIASDMHKPDGLTLIRPVDVRRVIDTLPIHKVPGVGPAALQRLDDLGIAFLGDVPKMSTDVLHRFFGKFGDRLRQLASGVDSTPVCAHTQRKSISSETTFTEDTNDLHFLKKVVLQHALTVAKALRAKGMKARSVTLKIRHADFRLFTRRCTLSTATQSSQCIYRAAVGLLQRSPMQHRLRLIGVGATDLISDTAPQQRSLFANDRHADHQWERVDRALDRIQHKFGRDMVHMGSLAKPERQSCAVRPPTPGDADATSKKQGG